MKSAPILPVTLRPGLGDCTLDPVTGERDFVMLLEAREIDQGHRGHKEIFASYGGCNDPALGTDLQQRKGWKSNNSPQFLQARNFGN